MVASCSHCFLCNRFGLVVDMTPDQALAFVLVAALIDFLIGF
jgi:hypothetical protein